MDEKKFELGDERTLVESVMLSRDIEAIARNASMMEIGDCTGYMQFGGWEVRKGVRFFVDDVKPSGYQITEAEALYCDIVKKENNYELYVSEAGKFFNREPMVSTDTLDVKELQKSLKNLIEDARKDIYKQYGVNLEAPKKEIKKVTDLSVLKKKRTKERGRVFVRQME